MARLVAHAVAEPGTRTAEEFSLRVRRLAATYLLLFVASGLGIALLLLWSKPFVTLAQRSNVETLTLLFFLVFFGYLAAISARGALGALRLAGYWLSARLGDSTEVERRKLEALGDSEGEPPWVALNVVLERADRPGAPIELEVADGVGSLGKLRVDRARLTHLDARRDGSYNLFPFLAEQVNDLLRRRGESRRVDVVQWKHLDDERTEEFLGLVDFAENLRAQLNARELWPHVILTPEECSALERRLSEICPALRNEGFLPHWEYRAEHKLPVIPEPLGLVSLSRSERRTDPIASMGCALMVVLFALGIIILFILLPPWVPGR